MSINRFELSGESDGNLGSSGDRRKRYKDESLFRRCNGLLKRLKGTSKRGWREAEVL